MRSLEFWETLPDYLERIINKFESSIKFKDYWEWQSHFWKQGYAMFCFRGASIKASRLAAFLFLGLDPFDKKTFACHYCDNKICVNPDHLFLGTHQQNVDYAHVNNRYFKGEKQPQSKLKEADILFIRKNFKARDKRFGIRALSRRFGIAHCTVQKILRHEYWRHI